MLGVIDKRAFDQLYADPRWVLDGLAWPAKPGELEDLMGSITQLHGCCVIHYLFGSKGLYRLFTQHTYVFFNVVTQVGDYYIQSGSRRWASGDTLKVLRLIKRILTQEGCMNADNEVISLFGLEVEDIRFTKRHPMF